MKKNVLMKSKRMAAFALSLSMILSEGSLAGAAEVNAGDAEPAVVTESGAGTDNAGTETTEVTELESEAAEAAGATEAAEQTTQEEEAEQTTPEEETEQAAPEADVPETEAATPVEDVVQPVADEAAQAPEAAETTEDETESADLEEETEEVGAYNGTPSKVIGLEGTNTYDDEWNEFDASFQTADGKYIYYSKVKSGVGTYNMPGTLEQYKDAATGLYLVNGRYYSWGSSYNGGVNFYGNDQVAAFVAGDSTTMAACQDKATGLYVLNGAAYGSVDNNGTVIYALVGSEGVGAGAAAATNDEAAAVLNGLGRNANASKASAAYNDYDYYEVNGQYFKHVNILPLDGKFVPVVYGEISFDKVKTGVKWNSLNTSNRVVNAEGKKIEVGYRLKVNDVIAGEENFSDRALQNDVIPAASATEGAMFLLTGTTNTYLKPLVGAGESAKIQVQGVYFVENEIVAADGSKTYTYTVDSVGEWSEPYTFKNTFAGKAPGSATGLKAVPEIGACLKAVQDGTKFKLTWNPVKEASYTQIVEIASEVPLNITAENFVKFLSLKGEAYLLSDKAVTVTEEEKAALLGTATTNNFTVIDDSSRDSSAEFDVNRDYAYHYFVVKAQGVAVENEYVNNTTNSNMVALTVAQTANIPQVTGFKAEKQSDGTYDLVWNPVDADVVVYAYEKKTLPEFFNLSLLNATAPVKVTDEYGDTTTRKVPLSDKLTSGQKALINKVDSVSNDGLEGDSGISTEDFDLKPGVTYYFTAYTYDDINNRDDQGDDQAPIATIDGLNFTRYTNFSPASKVVSVKNDLDKPAVGTKASKNSIKLTLSGAGNPTGYQIYKKNNKNKWKKIATITDDVYTDADLKENTKYSYKVRSYYYNKDNKKTIYSDYTYKTVSTSQVTDIAVKVTMKSTSQAKVTWTKVSKAEKYEIYRSNSSNVDKKVISKKYKNAGDFAQALDTAKFELVKTVKKAKTTSFTDKKLKAGETYTYVVMAYYKDGKKASGYIADSDIIEFAVHQPCNVQSENKGTSAKITWDADKFASKFEVKYTLYDKYGAAKSRKATVKSTKKNNYTIKGLESGGYASVSVRAYGKNKTYSEWSPVTNTTSLKVAGSITAKNTTEKLADGKTNNVVKISWKKVSGAKYYRVYRSTRAGVYNKDEKKYTAPGTPIAKESNTDERYDEVGYKEYLGESDSIIGTSAIDRAQLLEGVTYYYSVVAFGEKNTEIASYVTSTGSKFAYATSKPASVVFNRDLKISSIKNSKKGQVAVKYNKVKDAKQYVIYRADKKNGTFKKIGTSKKTSYTDKNVKKGKTYYYKVVATGTNKAKANMEVTSSVKKIKVKK